MEPRSPARQMGLVVVVFVATFALLAGGWAVLGRVGTNGSGSPRPSGIALASPSGPPGPGSSGGSGVPGTGSPPVDASPPAGGSGDATVVLIGASDIADCALPGARQTSDLLLGQAGSIFTAGDNSYEDGSVANYADCFGPTWGRVKDRIALPVAGNHDWNTAGAAGYLGYFGTTASPQGTTWYSKDLAAWHVVVLDSSCAKVGGCDADSAQGRWLKQDLAASTAHCTLAIWHQPRFSSGEHGNDLTVAPFWDQLHGAGAELVINGHDHDFERFAPQDPAGILERPGGLREIVVGTGGAELRSFHAQAANSEFRQSGIWGVIRLTLHPVNYDWEFLPAGGAVADSGSTPCH